MHILGIETSCDETAASVVMDGVSVLSSIVYSQIAIHHPFGGVVPELASRKHLESITTVVEEAIRTAGIEKGDLDAVAVTQGPGLIGSLLVGFSFAKAFSACLEIPLIGIDHLEGHLNSVFLESDPPEFPYTALLASGGHTSIYYVTSHTRSDIMGQTRDDAAGEAFDKVAKMLGLGYPGGAVISQFADKGNPQCIRFPRPFLDKNHFDFSFSGIKTSVKRYIQTHPDDYLDQVSDIAAGFQESVVEVLNYKIIHAAKTKGCRHIAIVGGVAANRELRNRVRSEAAKAGIKVHIPSIELCGDNAAMIASCGYHHFKNGNLSGLNEDVYSRIRQV